MKTGILGGAFNPPHIAHLLLADYASEALNLDKVLFIPTKNPPHKKIDGNWDAELRYLLIQIASFSISPFELKKSINRFQIPNDGREKNPTILSFLLIYENLYPYYHNPHWEVSNIEINNASHEYSYTVNTIRKLKVLNPNDEFTIIIGCDQAEVLNTWKELENIKKMAAFAVGNRREKKLSNILEKFPFITTFEFPQIDFSSTMVRERIRNHQLYQHLVPGIIGIFITLLPELF